MFRVALLWIVSQFIALRADPFVISQAPNQCKLAGIEVTLPDFANTTSVVYLPQDPEG